MNTLSNRLAAFQQRSNENLVAFLRTEVDLGLTLAGVAKTSLGMGHESWERSAQHAEDAYSEVERYLGSPRYAERISEEERRKIAAGMERLRKALDEVPRSDQQDSLRRDLCSLEPAD